MSTLDPEPEPDEPSSLLARIKRRKLFQWAIAYAGGAWLLLQLLALLAQPFAWPALVMRAAVVLLAVGFVAAMVLAWFHAEKGEQKAGGMELLMLGALLIVAATGVLIVSRGRAADAGLRRGIAVGDSAVARSIAVLPFANMSSDPEQEYFSDGMMEDILTNLSKIGSLRVISRTSAMTYKGTSKLVPEIARELGVAHVVEGSVRRQGELIRITAQLIRASDDAHLWAESYDRDIADLFAVQTEIAQQIATALQAEITGAEQARLEVRPTENLEAYDLYLRGREYFRQLQSREDTERAIRLFQRALELDASFSLAEAALASAYARRAYRFGHGPEWADSAVERAQRAIASDSNLAEGHYALGYGRNVQGDPGRAEAAWQRALALNPNHALTLNGLGGLALYRGELAEALQLFEESTTKLDPSDPANSSNTFNVRLMLGDLAGAQQWMRGMGERFPEADYDHEYGAQLALARGQKEAAARLILTFLERISDASAATSGAILLFSGQTAEAAQVLERAVSDQRTNPGVADIPNAAVLLGYVRWKGGDRTGANTLFRSPVIEQQERLNPYRGGVEYRRASVAAAQESHEEALRWLEAAVRAGWHGWVMGRYNPMFEGLWGDPRYEALMRQAKATIDRQREEMKRRGL